MGAIFLLIMPFFPFLAMVDLAKACIEYFG